MATKPGLTRRSFLKTSVLTLAGMSLISACAPTAPAPAATAAPAAAAKPAEAAKPAAGAAAAKSEPKIGSQLIGKLEGPEVVTDPAQFPKTFKEAPMLADLVKAGKLPPVEQRV